MHILFFFYVHTRSRRDFTVLIFDVYCRSKFLVLFMFVCFYEGGGGVLE